MRYIGCKTLLLDNIKEVIDRHAPEAETFCDIFSGTATVARYFKEWYEVYSNDLLFFSYCLQKATVEMPEKPTFNTLFEKMNISNPIKYFNDMDSSEMEVIDQKFRFFQNNYSPLGGRMYMTDVNALRIDYARNTINSWKSEGLITELEYFYLVAAVVEGVPFVSNISGTYGAYNKKWDARSNKKFELVELDVTRNQKKNRSFNEEGVQLLNHINGDVLYIDPPYNERQYLSNYHVLETAAKYDEPELRGITGQRLDEKKKSAFCSRRTVVPAFEELIRTAKFQHIILSYNTDGIMSLSDIEFVMKKYGIPETFEVNFIPYRRFKSRSEENRKDELKEMLIYIRKVV